MSNQNIKEDILKLKKEKNITIIAHNYQDPDILDVADFYGDSFALSKIVSERPEIETVIMCGVRFMAETVKILSPEKKVILSVADAGCPMADQIQIERIKEYKKANPSHAIVSYINTNSLLKTVSDVCVTSSSAVKIINSLPHKNILFVPDQNLGAYVSSKCPDKIFHLLEGYCPVHDNILESHVLKCKEEHPNALLLMHGECRQEALKHADFIGSTKEIIDYALANIDKEVIFGTERGVYDYLHREHPEAKFYQLEENLLTCKDMKKTTLTSVLEAINSTGGEIIELEEDLRLRALTSISAMIELGA